MSNIIIRSNPYAKQLLWGILILFGSIFLVYYTEWLLWLRFSFAYMILFALYIFFNLTMRIYRLGTGPISAGALVAGVISIIGGAAFDMIVTVVKSPMLDMEANPIARALLDSGQTVAFVYGYALTAQLLVAALGCMMWAAFLRHRAELVSSAKNTDPRSWFDFVKAMTGGGHLSWRQYFLPLNLSELPTYYHVFWIFVVIWVAFTPFRFYFGLEWLGIFPGLRIQALIIWGVLVGIGYFLWLWLEYKNVRR